MQDIIAQDLEKLSILIDLLDSIALWILIDQLLVPLELTVLQHWEQLSGIELLVMLESIVKNKGWLQSLEAVKLDTIAPQELFLTDQP